MKQKVVVRAIVKDHKGRSLFLRRKGGRPSIAGRFELPGGKMIAGEQPADAMRRTLKYHTGLEAGTVQLFDVLGYIDPDDRRLQYVFVVYLVSINNNNEKISLDNGYDRYIWKIKSELQQIVVTNSTKIILDIHEFGSNTRSTPNTEKFIIYSDGGSRGNPGPSAAGYVIMDSNEDVLVEDGRYLGVVNNNLAEYAGVYLALLKARALGIRHIEVRSDSLLVVNQLNSIYSNTDAQLEILRDKILSIVKKFEFVRFKHVRREFNSMADGIVNKILDDVVNK